MTSRVIALPMYNQQPEACRAFWRGLETHMRRAGLHDLPEEMIEPQDLYLHWLDPSLLLSHTCGYPLSHALADKVRLVGVPVYSAAGVGKGFYTSRIVVRDDDPARAIGDLRGRCAAFNARDSHSGYNALRALVAPHAVDGRFFGATIESGAHVQSLALLQAGTVDVAAIDCVTYALVSDAMSQTVSGLRTLCFTAKAPSPPLITSSSTTLDEVERLQRAFAAACADPELAGCRAALRLEGLEILRPEDYLVCRDVEAQAVAQGYPVLN